MRSAPYAQPGGAQSGLEFSVRQGAHGLTGPNLDVAGSLFVVADVLATCHHDPTNSTRWSFDLRVTLTPSRIDERKLSGKAFARFCTSGRFESHRAALSDGRAEAASRRRSRQSSSAMLRREDATRCGCVADRHTGCRCRVTIATTPQLRRVIIGCEPFTKATKLVVRVSYAGRSVQS